MATPKVKYIVQVVDKASAQFKRMGAAAKKMAVQIAKLSSTAAIAAATAMIKLGAGAAKAADEIQKLATQLGISTTALSEYQFVAQQTGVAFNQFALGIQRSTRRIAEAAQGTGEAQGALKELGLDAKELSKLSPDKQFEALTESLRNVSNESDQLRLAFKLFDSEGVKLLRTIKSEAGEIDRLRARSRELGVSFNSDLTQKAAEVVDAFGEMKAASVGLGAAILDLGADSATGSAGFVTNTIIGLKDVIRVFTEGQKSGAGFGAVITALFNKDPDSLREWVGHLDNIRAEAAAAADAVKSIVEIDIGGSPLLERRETDPGQIVGGINPEALPERREEVPPGIDPVLWREAQSILEGIKTPLDNYNEGMNLATKLMREGLIPATAYFERTQQLGEEYDTAAAAAKSFTDEQERVNKSFDAIGDAATDTVGDLVRGFADGTAKIGDLFTAMASRIIEQLFEIYVVEQLIGSITSSFGGGKVAARQLGGPVFQGQPVLVGERGPELFVPPSGGKIVSSDNAFGAVNVNFQVNSLDPRTAAAVIVDNRQVIVGVIKQAFERGGRPAPIR